jgi:drug/metabolite transporter (DMT)-like permease
MMHIARLRKIPFSLSRQELLLVAITMVWGGTFLVVHIAMRHSGPLFFVGLRFVAAGLLTLLLFRRSMAGLTRLEFRAGLSIGVAIFLGYALQTYGLQTITSSQSAFISALYVPMVPFLQWFVLRRAPHPMSWVGIAFAFVGLLLLAGPAAGSVALGKGEVATLLGAVAIAVEIILVGRYAGRVDTRRITIVQLLAAGMFSLVLMPVAGEALPEFSWTLFACVIGLAVASALIQFSINWAQKTVSPTRATVIYAGEPVWGGLIGRLAGDRLPALAIVGAGLIVVGVLVSEWRPGRRSQRKTVRTQPPANRVEPVKAEI